MSPSRRCPSASTTAVTPTYYFKLVLLGDAAVGKSCLVVRFARNEFFGQQEPTIGAAFMAQVIPIEGANVRLEIWDTAGSERYRSVASMYYRGAAAAVVVYDICSESSFRGAQHWVDELHAKHSLDILIALVGNKIDMESQRVIESQRGQQYAEKHNLLFFETSAKTGEHVFEVFREIASRLPKHPKEQQDAEPGVQLSSRNAAPPKSINSSIWSCCFADED